MVLTEDTLFLYSQAQFSPGESILELCCGEAEVLGDMASRFSDCSFTGIDLKANPTNDGNLRILRGDVRTARELFKPHDFDLILSNPPYFSAKKGRVPKDKERLREHFDDSLKIDVLLNEFTYLLKPGGKFYFVFPTSRLFETMQKADKRNLKIYSVQFRHNSINRDSDLCLFYGKNRKGVMEPAIKYPFINFKKEE